MDVAEAGDRRGPPRQQREHLDQREVELGERKRDGQVLVAFGAEHGEAGLQRKRAMLETKNADLVVYNDVGRGDIGFDTHENEVVLLARDGERHVAKAPKPVIAAAILDEVERLMGVAR